MGTQLPQRVGMFGILFVICDGGGGQVGGLGKPQCHLSWDAPLHRAEEPAREQGQPERAEG